MVKTRKDLTQNELKSLIAYDGETGLFTWAVTRSNVRAGDSAGCLSPTGRYVIGVSRKLYLAHRLAWLWTYGEWPSGEIDHINNDPSDNRIINLRVTTRAENQRNVRLLARNKSGIKGVSWDSINSKWVVRINIGGQQLNLGRFESIDLAAQAIREGRERLHGEYANHG